MSHCGAVRRQGGAQLRAQSREADVDAGQEQDQAEVGIEHTNQDLDQAAAGQPQQRQLEDQKNRRRWGAWTMAISLR